MHLASEKKATVSNCESSISQRKKEGKVEGID
jgi:hypothetical protein